jgi:hypothetical protein
MQQPIVLTQLRRVSAARQRDRHAASALPASGTATTATLR